MKPKILLFTLIGSLLFALILWIYSTTQSTSTYTVFTATVNRDCAPWDGMAYTITIPDQTGSEIIVSIWKIPDSSFPTTYSFPDSSGRVGTVIYQSASGSVQQVSGKITLQPFTEANPIEGKFNFRVESGKQITGNFKAEWASRIALCG